MIFYTISIKAYYSLIYHSNTYHLSKKTIETILYSTSNDKYSKNDVHKSNYNTKQTKNKKSISNNNSVLTVRLNKCINGLSRRAADEAIAAGIYHFITRFALYS